MAKELKKLTKNLFFQLAADSHKTVVKYWLDENGMNKERSIESLLFLVQSELSESGDAARIEKPEFSMLVRECKSTEHWKEIKDLTFPELAGCLLRIFDIFGASIAGRFIYAGYNTNGLQEHILPELLALESKRMPKTKIKGKNEYELRESVLRFYFRLNCDICKATNEPKKLVRIVFKIWQYCLDQNCDIFNLITYADLANKNRPAKIA